MCAWEGKSSGLPVPPRHRPKRRRRHAEPGPQRPSVSSAWACSAQSGARHPTLTGPKSRSEDPRSGVIKRHHRSPSAVQKAADRPVDATAITKVRTAVTRSDTRLHPISWSRAQTSERSKNALAPRTSAPHRCTHTRFKMGQRQHVRAASLHQRSASGWATHSTRCRVASGDVRWGLSAAQRRGAHCREAGPPDRRFSTRRLTRT